MTLILIAIGVAGAGGSVLAWLWRHEVRRRKTAEDNAARAIEADHRNQAELAERAGRLADVVEAGRERSDEAAKAAGADRTAKSLRDFGPGPMPARKKPK